MTDYGKSCPLCTRCTEPNRGSAIAKQEAEMAANREMILRRLQRLDES